MYPFFYAEQHKKKNVTPILLVAKNRLAPKVSPRLSRTGIQPFAVEGTRGTGLE